MIVIGTATAILGLWLALNLLRSADKLAASARTLSWWRKGNPFADYAIVWRVLGLTFAVFGIALILAGLGLHP